MKILSTTKNKDHKENTLFEIGLNGLSHRLAGYTFKSQLAQNLTRQGIMSTNMHKNTTEEQITNLESALF